MTTWKKICCAVDLSEPSRLALKEAASLANHFQAELTLLHVHEPAPVDAAEVVVSPAKFYEHTAREMEPVLAGWRKEAEEIARRSVKMIVLTGKAAPEILGYIREHGFDLVVISTHGRTGLKHVVMGSVAEQIVRAAGRPILVVPASRG